MKLLHNSNFVQIFINGVIVVESSLTYHSFINTSANGSSRRLSFSVLPAILF